MANISITREFSFSYGHQLPRHMGKCQYEHGHNARLLVTVSGPLTAHPESPKLGMVEDFGNVKAIVNQEVVDVFDHKFLAHGREAPCIALNMAKGVREAILDDLLPPGWQRFLDAYNIERAERNIVLLGFPTTAECLAIYTFVKVQAALADGYLVEEVVWYETDLSQAKCVRQAYLDNEYVYTHLADYFRVAEEDYAMDRGG